MNDSKKRKVQFLEQRMSDLFNVHADIVEIAATPPVFHVMLKDQDAVTHWDFEMWYFEHIEPVADPEEAVIDWFRANLEFYLNQPEGQAILDKSLED